ncbi:DUF4403 family protein [Sinorhizobium meliloti]|uniref:DUF4403 family protein n=1 Tax=Rhizobium meliloti TaxID=382 RepID=UPI000FDA28E2|nr:DUF4403 family protein [Sinorhizobium meliloti]RVG01813.1 DUF4403 family protein [Sinorhizobium meliloti]
MRKRAVLISAVVLTIAAAAGFYAWYGSRHQQLSEAVPRVGTNVSLPVRDSKIGVRLAVPYSVLQTAINQRLPYSFSKAENGPNYCADIVFVEVCVGTRYQFTANRTDVTVSRNGDRLHVKMGVAVRGRGGFRGSGADLLDLDAKNFRAAANISADVGVSIGPDFCPVATATPTLDWTENPRVEIVSRVWISLANALEGSVGDMLNDLSRDIQLALPCDKVRAEVARVWRGYDFPVALPDGSQVHVLLTPREIATSGLVVDDAEMRIAAEVVGATEVATAPREIATPPLPTLGGVGDAPGAIDISLPINAGYDFLGKQAMSQFGGKPIEVDTPLGKGTVTINGAEIYPAGEKVAVALDFTADLPTYFLDVSGKIYAVGKPVIDETGMKLGISDFDYSRILDNDLWEILSAAFESKLKDMVARDGVFDLTSMAQDGAAKLQEAIADPANTGGLKLEVTNFSSRIDAIVPQEQSLTAVVNVKANLDSEVTLGVLAQ